MYDTRDKDECAAGTRPRACKDGYAGGALRQASREAGGIGTPRPACTFAVRELACVGCESIQAEGWFWRDETAPANACERRRLIACVIVAATVVCACARVVT